MSANDRRNGILDHPNLGAVSPRIEVTVTFDGQTLSGFQDESIGSLLRAHGIVVNRTMQDTDAPRGIFCGVGRCPDCMMTVDGKSNVLACVTRVRDGMVIETQQGLGIWTVRR